MTETEWVGARLRELVAEEVRAELGRRRISGAKLARALHEPQASLQRRLSGQYPFDVDLLGRIADYLGVPVTVFFGRTMAGAGHPGAAPSLSGPSDVRDHAPVRRASPTEPTDTASYPEIVSGVSAAACRPKLRLVPAA